MYNMELDEESIAKLEHLTNGLRSSELDHRSIADELGTGRPGTHFDRILYHILYHSPAFAKILKAEHGSHRKSWRLHTSPRKDQPNKMIVQLLSEIGFEEQLFAYLSGFCGPPCGGLSRACECLQLRRESCGEGLLFCTPMQELNFIPIGTET